MHGDQLAQQVAVDGRVARQERRAEAGGELRLHADQSLLGAGDLRGVAGEEVVHRLRRRQLGDGRHHAKRVGREHHQVLRLPGATRARRVRDELEGIGRARVLSLALVVEVDDPRVRIERDVLQHRAEAQRRVVDLGLGFARELDALRVASALEIEHAVRTPAVLIVADQGAVRIGGERGLAGTGQAEEQRHVSLLADVRRAVHRHHAFGREIVVERREHGLLHLAGIEAAADQDHAFGEVERDHCLGAHAVAFRIGLEGRQAEDGEIRDVVRQVLALRADQQRADEQRVPGELSEHARLDAVFRIGAAIKVLREKLLAARVLEEIVQQHVKLFGRKLAVLLPPNRALRLLVAHHELVLRRATGVNAGRGAERAALDHMALVGIERVFIELFGRQIPVDRREVLQTEFFGTVRAVPQARLFHARPPPNYPAKPAAKAGTSTPPSRFRKEPELY